MWLVDVHLHSMACGARPGICMAYRFQKLWKVGPTDCAISVPFPLALINHRTNGSTYSPGESRKHHAFPGTGYSDSDAYKVRKAMIAAAKQTSCHRYLYKILIQRMQLVNSNVRMVQLIEMFRATQPGK